MQTSTSPVSYATALTRGLKLRCPQCGVGTLLRGYLKPVKECEACGCDFSHISADDGPAWATILIMGHMVVPLMLYFGRDDSIPLWIACVTLSVIMLIGVYVTLPRAKGFFIALIWMTGATGDNMAPNALDQSDETHNRF